MYASSPHSVSDSTFLHCCPTTMQDLSSLWADHHLLALATIGNACADGDASWNALLRCARKAERVAWEHLHTGPWHRAPLAWRALYSVACVAQVLARISPCLPPSEADPRHVRRCIRCLDMALLMGHPDCGRRILPVIDLLCDWHAAVVAQPDASDAARKQPVLHAEGMVAVVVDPSHAMPRVEAPSLMDFEGKWMLDGGSPVVITGAMQQWPALTLWDNMAYLKRVAGLRTVPVELGHDYMSPEWRQGMMTLGHFIDTYVSQGATHIAYVAQIQLFEQIPRLERDILVPDYTVCECAEDVAVAGPDAAEEPLVVNAWFGPQGTVSRLHHDPRHNLLAQVVGRKLVRMWHPRHSSSLYPHSGRMSNTSRVDVAAPDLQAFPDFASVANDYVECILEPGQMLYIPPRHWH